VAATSAGEKRQSGELRPNLDRLTVGVDLGDQWSHYCILGLEGEKLAEGQLHTTQQHIAEFFQALNASRVVFEVGTHSPWVQEGIHGCGHEVVANPRLIDGSKRRKRKNDRIDANKLARLGRVDPQSLHPMRHRSKEVRQDLWYYEPVMRWWRRGPNCSSPSFAQNVEEASSRRDPRSTAALGAYGGGTVHPRLARAEDLRGNGQSAMGFRLALTDLYQRSAVSLFGGSAASWSAAPER
jgi:hypothetical protein